MLKVITYEELVSITRNDKMMSAIDYSNPFYYDHCDVVIMLQEKINKYGLIKLERK